MGYNIFSFGINTDKIKNTFGSGDSELQRKVEENEVFKNYSDFKPENFETTPDKALIDIIGGRVFDKKSNYAYGYALIGICATLGKELPYTQEINLGYETDIINKVLADDFKIKNFDIEESLFVDNSSPFPIPKIDDWPVISLLTKHQLQNLKVRLATINISDDQIQELEGDPEERDFGYAHSGRSALVYHGL